MNGEKTYDNVEKRNGNEYNRSLGSLANFYSSDPRINAAIDEYADGDGVIRDIDDDVNKEYENNPTSWQSECFEKIKSEKNVILSSPTGSGKTRVFLEWCREKKEQAKAQGKKHTIYITAPIKALSNQRFRELEEQGFKVGLETGDIKNVPEDADYICCTQEIYTNKYLDDKNATLIMDEFHYIFEDDRRARTYIDSLHKSKAENVLLASATFGDTEKFCGYVNKVSGRDFYNYKNEKRITSLEYKGEIESDKIEDSLVVTFSAKNCRNIANSLWWEREDREISHEEIDNLASEMKIDNNSLIDNCKRGVAYYYGAMLPKEKLFVEKLFEKRLIDTVVGTDALALGVNFPVQKVVFVQLAKYYDGPISKNLFEQLSGRAGRKGYFDAGEVYYCDFGVENNDYYTSELFQEILEKDNEDANISLAPNIKDILSGKTSIDEEKEYIARFSTGQVDRRDIQKEIDYVFEKIIYYKCSLVEDENEDSIMEIFDDTSIPPSKIDLYNFILSICNEGCSEDLEKYFLEHPEKRYIGSIYNNDRNNNDNTTVRKKEIKERLELNGSIPSEEEMESMAKQALEKILDISKIPAPSTDMWEVSRYTNPELFDLAKEVYTGELYKEDDRLKFGDPKVDFLFHVFEKLLPDRGYETDGLVKKWLAGNMVYLTDSKNITLSGTYDDIKQLKNLVFLERWKYDDYSVQYATIKEIVSGSSKYCIYDNWADHRKLATQWGDYENFVSDIIKNTESGKNADMEVSRFDLLPYAKQLRELIDGLSKEKLELATDFEKYIAEAYFEEFSVDINCKVLSAILRGENVEQIMDDFCYSFSDLLQFRKYFKQLPRNLRKGLDFYYLDKKINEIDDTALRIGRIDNKKESKNV